MWTTSSRGQTSAAWGLHRNAQIYKDSELKEMAEDGTLGFPAPEPLPNDTQDMPFFFVGDNAFGLRKTMMKPYSLLGLEPEELIFNYHLGRGGWYRMHLES